MICEFFVILDEFFVTLCVGEGCRVCFPRCLTRRQSDLYFLEGIRVREDIPRASRPVSSRNQKCSTDRCQVKSYHWIHQFDTIITWRIVARSDHHTNDLAIQLSRAQGCQHSCAEDNRVEERAIIDKVSAFHVCLRRKLRFHGIQLIPTHSCETGSNVR